MQPASAAPTHGASTENPSPALNRRYPERGLTRRVEAWLWIAQRASAAAMAVFVAVHLGTMIYAVRGGLSAGEILGRTHGQVAWLLFYGLFIVAAAIHAPIGLRVVAREWLGWRGPSADVAAMLAGAGLLAGGLRAIWGLYA